MRMIVQIIYEIRIYLRILHYLLKANDFFLFFFFRFSYLSVTCKAIFCFFSFSNSREKMKPPTRKRKITNRAKGLHMEEYSKWTLSERQRLLKALEKLVFWLLDIILKLLI